MIYTYISRIGLAQARPNNSSATDHRTSHMTSYARKSTTKIMHLVAQKPTNSLTFVTQVYTTHQHAKQSETKWFEV